MIAESKQQHWDEIKAIYIQGIHTQNATFQCPNNIPEYAEWIKSKLKQTCFVFLEDDRVQGWASLLPVSSSCVYAGVAEVSVYVASNAYGKGIGTQLMQQLINFSESHGVWTLQAGIFPENTSSIALHKKVGFREVGVREKIGKLNGVWRDTLLFEKRSLSVL